MSFFASAAGLQVVSGSLVIPLVGAWTADLQLAGATVPSGPVSVVLGNLTLLGTVYRAAPYGGQVRVRLVGGYAGWRKTIADQGYGSDGVLLSHVLGDAAAACGEQVSVPSDATIGPAFARLEGPASDVLWQLLAQGIIPSWHVAPSGITTAAPWPTTAVTSPFTATNQHGDEGVVTIATEDYASWLPGGTFASPLLAGTLTNTGVVYTFGEDGQARLDVLTGTTDRLLGPLRAFVDSRLAPARFFGRYAYTITGATTSTIDGAPQDRSLGLPELRGVLLASDSISSYLPPEGGEAHVQFVDGKATSPVCVWTSGAPSLVQIASGLVPVARTGDLAGGMFPIVATTVVTMAG